MCLADISYFVHFSLLSGRANTSFNGHRRNYAKRKQANKKYVSY